ncbi:MAG: hypothetical protein ACI4SM_00700 [Candidatus Gastranaerophilaceae bacterium]
MARKPKNKSVYERIEETKSEISLTEQHLTELKSQLENLFAEKDDLEMRQTWQLLKDKGMTINDIQKMLLKQNNEENKQEKESTIKDIKTK